jgi:hypothetical protein
MVRGAVQVGGQAVSFGPAIVGTSTEWAFDETRVEELRRVSQTSGGRELLEMSQAWRSPTVPRFTDLSVWLLILALLLVLWEALVTRTGWKLPQMARAEVKARPMAAKPPKEALQHQERLQAVPAKADSQTPVASQPEPKTMPATEAERQSRFQRAKKR